MKSLLPKNCLFLLVFFILTLFFLTNVKDANAACTSRGASVAVYTIPFTLNKGCLGSPTTYTLPFSTEYGTYYTLPTTINYYYGEVAYYAGSTHWYAAPAGGDCTTRCANLGGTIGGTNCNWQDPGDYSVPRYWYPSCIGSGATASGPRYNITSTYCWIRYDYAVTDCLGAGADNIRFCACVN